MSERDAPIEIINPPNMLKVKVGGRLPTADPSAIARAEKALDEIKGEFRDWLRQEVEKLEAAYVRVRESGVAGEPGEALFTVAHDLRGLGETYEFPIVTRIAGSLSKLLDTEEKRAEAPLGLVEAHVGAIGAALRQNIRFADVGVGQQLAEELEARVVALVGEAT